MYLIFYNVFIANPNFDIFSFSNEICPICFCSINIPIYSKDCKHIFCYCCISRWLNQQITCPLCRISITKVGYFAPNSKNGTIIINSGDFRLKANNRESDGRDSKYCIKCKKCEPANELLICKNRKYNLTHISCGKIDISNIQNYICDSCNEN